jgi:hypothetical protein
MRTEELIFDLGDEFTESASPHGQPIWMETVPALAAGRRRATGLLEMGWLWRGRGGTLA